MRFSTEISVYVRNGTRYAHGCYGYANHRRQIDPCRFQRPQVTLNLGFKVTVYLQVEYVNLSYGQSYCRTLIGNHTQSIECTTSVILINP